MAKQMHATTDVTSTRRQLLGPPLRPAEPTRLGRRLRDQLGSSDYGWYNSADGSFPV
jgi:hypothetical protein